MTQKETNLRSVLFLVIGVLLLLSLIICIYIVSGERDLAQVSSEVVELVDPDSGGMIVTYDVDGQTYRYDYGPNTEHQVGDKIKIYYHTTNPSLVQKFKTNKLIFIFPVIGLALCILGLFELFKKNDDDDDEEFETSVIGVVGNTQQLKIVTDDTEVKSYEPTPEEVVEAPVKAVVKEEVQPVVEESAPVVEQTVVEVSEPVFPAELPTEPVQDAQSTQVVETASVAVSAPAPEVEKTLEEVVATPAPQPVVEQTPAPVAAAVTMEAVTNVEPKAPESNSSVAKMEAAIVQKVKNETGGAALNEDDIKKVIKDVLKEVIQEVKEDKGTDKPVVQKRVLPNYYYIAGTSLIYEEAGKEPQEIELKTIKSIVRTVNNAGNVVKLVVSNDAVKCVLTNMKNIDLEQLASLLNNKMRTIDEAFREEIEYKEY